MVPFTEEGTAEVTFVFVDGQPTGFIVDSEDTDSGSGEMTQEQVIQVVTLEVTPSFVCF